jgi:hypothetical protein
MALPSSQATLMRTCPGLRPRWCPENSPLRAQDCCLPTACKGSAFISSYLKTYPMSTTIQISGLNNAACALAPPGFGLPLLGLPADVTTDLLARL